MEKNNKKYLIIIIILILVILTMGIYIVINNAKTITTNANVQQENTPAGFSEFVNNITNSMKKMNIDFTNYKDSGLDEGMEDEYIIIENNNDYILKDIINVEINYKGEAFVNISPDTKLYDNYGNKHKLKSEVINAGIYKMGNSDYSYIYLVNKDGTISYVDSTTIYEENLIDVIQIEGLSNIISLIQVNQLENSKVRAVDIYGNIHNLNK